jgi:carbon monoxide dehydrogenase subunit G
MRVEGTREFQASRERVWAIISNPAEMVTLMRGAEDFEVVDATHWRAKVRVPIGPGLRLTMNFEHLEQRPLEFASLRGNGKTFGAGLEMTTSYTLRGEGEHTSMAWDADVSLSGILGSMGEGTLQPIISQQVEGIMDALEQRLGGAA